MSGVPCANCGEAKVRERIVPFLVEHAGASVSISDRQTFCDGCGTISYVGSQISEHELAHAAAIRAIDGLLSPQDLLKIRLKYRLKQTDMEQMLATGPKTWTRWERGKVPHSRATDKLIRLIAEDSQIAKRLFEDAKVNNAEAYAVFNEIQEAALRRASDLLKVQISQLGAFDNEEAAERIAYDWLGAVERLRHDATFRAEAA